MWKVLSLTIFCAALQGCALTDATLDVGHDPAQLSRGPLSEAGEKTFVLLPLNDEREDVARVGYKTNGFGANTADIMTNEPVTQILIDAIDAGLLANGHSVGAEGISVSGAVNQFWVYSDTNFTNIEIVCNIETDLIFSDMATDRVIYQALYNGSFSDKFQTGMEGNYQSVISGAIQALVDDLVYDEELVEALSAF